MAKFSDVEFVFFDYGGVLDSHGVHTRTLFWDAVVSAQLFAPEEELRKQFQEAYTWADQELMRSGSALGMGLAEFNHHNLGVILKALEVPKISEHRLQAAADELTFKKVNCLEQSAKVLAQIDRPKGIISNFTGNLEVILKEQKLAQYFEHVTESYYVKAAKPDLTIFLTALSKVDFAPEECAFVGDNPKNDLEPARSLGMKTIYFTPERASSPFADLSIAAIDELSQVFS